MEPVYEGKELVAEAANAYLHGKVNTKLDSSYSAIKDLAQSDKKKKGASKAIPLFRNFTYCRVKEPFLKPCLDFICYDDKRLQRLCHLLADAACPVNGPPQTMFSAITVALEAELSQKSLSVARRMLLFRTFSRLTLGMSPSERKDLDASMTGVLRGEDPDAKQKKGKVKTDKDSKRRLALLQLAALRGLRQRPLQKDLFASVIRCLSSDEPVAARHAAGITLRYLKEDSRVNELAGTLHLIVTGSGKEPIANSDDVLTRIYLVKLFSMLAAPEAKIDNELSKIFYSHVCVRIRDKSSRVCFEAIRALTELGWERLVEAYIPVQVEKDAHLITMAGGGSTAAPPGTNITTASTQGSKVLSEVISRLNSSIATPITKRQAEPLLWASLRAASQVGKCFIFFTMMQRDECEEQDPLHGLVGPLHAMLTNSPERLRLGALTALIWLAHTKSCELQVHRIILQELQTDSLDAGMLHELFAELHQRVEASPRSAEFAIQLIEDVCFHRPSKAPHGIISELYHTILHRCKQTARRRLSGRVIVLESVFRILDRRFRKHTQADILELETTLVWFLGENCKDLINQSSSSTIVLRLQHAAMFGALETRRVALEALEKVSVAQPSQKDAISSFIESNSAVQGLSLRII